MKHETVLTFPSRECVDLSHKEQQQREVDGGLRTAGSDKRNPPQQYSAYGCVAHARTVYGRQRCNVVLCACFLLSTCYMPGLCTHESLGIKQIASYRNVHTK